MSFKPVQEPAQTSSRREQSAMEVKDLSVRFEGESDPIFENLTFNLIKGKHLVLVGRNGCGKTTL